MDRAKGVALLAGIGLLCSCSSSTRVVVGSKNFTEQLILGEIIAQRLEHLEVPVDRRLNLGGTLLAHQALVSGEIDLYPEYTGTALTAVLSLPPAHDAQEVFAKVAKEYDERFGIRWLPPLGFNNSFVMVVPGADARSQELETVSDAAAAQDWILGAGYEFERRADGLPALNRAYNLRWSAAPRIMDLGLLYRALEQGQVTMVAANGTDGLLSKLDVTALRDDRGIFPPYEAAILVREELVERIPGVREALEELSGAISQETMQKLNYQVDGEHRPIADVARDFLDSL